MIERGRHRGWWALGLVVVVCAFFATTGMAFGGAFVRSVDITVTSDRAGLVMEVGGKVKMRGIEVGRVATVNSRPGGVTLDLALQPDAIRYMPANLEAQIRTTTLFGAKYVDLIYPEVPDEPRLRAGAVIPSRNVTTEVNTVFQNLTTVLQQVEPAKVNAVVTAFSDAVRSKGQRMGEATTSALELIAALNARTDTIQRDLNSLAGAADTYTSAANDVIDTLSALTTTGRTIADQSGELQAALLSTIGLSHSGIDLLAPNAENFVNAFSKLPSTTGLLHTYSPTFTCLFQGAHWILTDSGGYVTNGRSNVVDTAVLALAQDPYRYPDHLPVIGAKGGPDGKPGCGALPRPDLNMPVRYLVTNTGYGTGLDIRPNPGIAHPWLVNFFPTTKGVPEPPRIYGGGRPAAIGPVPYPNAPPYGASLFGPDGAPLWAGPPPGAPPPPVPGVPVPPPPYGPGPAPEAPSGAAEQPTDGGGHP
ncbi:MCE family protein [[Mycobacterium] burgundiense]|uniref:MCE family protein n=1 Tax=[Mycobacterium] burgundiense TaxID=3064286 RepID=A0ABN9MWS5_9MYCO|nr:MCE family protein [Mycolicibacterium sp. MU0053]CAJ1496046.1 MCE family protein [Mycolicibacterium sp. MU0053]